MQSVSQYYLDAISNPPCEWDFEIRVKKKKELALQCTLTSADVVASSITVNRVALKDKYMGVAGAGSARLSFTLTASGVVKMEAVNRLCKNTFLDFYVWLKTADPYQSTTDFKKNTNNTENESGRVHIGEFHIVTVNSTAFDCSVEAYDAMIAFDRYVRAAERKALNSQEHTFEYLLNAFCTRCSKGVFNVVLDPNLDFTTFPNGTMTLGVDKDIKFENYREVIVYMAQLLGCFAYITRDGELSFKYFNQTADLELGSSDVFTHEFGGVYYEIFSIETNIAGFDYSVDASTQEPANPATIYLNENPFLRKLEPDNDGSQTELSAATKGHIDEVLAGIAGIKFNGGVCGAVYRPELDLGDMVTVTVKTMINHQTVTDVTYTYVLLGEINETYITGSTLRSFDYCGSVDIASNSSNFKGSEGGGGGGGTAAPLASVIHIQGKENQTVTTINTTLFNANNTSIKADANMPVLVFFTGTFEAETDTHLTLGYTYDGISFNELDYNLVTGRNTVNFSAGFDAIEQELIHHFGLYARVNHGSVSLAKLDHQLNIYSSGATSTEPTWSGFYTVQDVVPSLECGMSMSFNNIESDEVSVGFDVD